MATASLSASARPDTGKGVARTLRAAGRVPAVIYGHARAPQGLSLDARELGKLLGRIAAEATVIELSIDGTSSRTLIREVQRHPFKKQILHVDFQELVAGEKVIVRIPLQLVGTSEGVRLNGGIMDQPLRELVIRCDPAIIPSHIDVDISSLNLGDSIHVRELKLADGIEVETDMDATICVCAAPRAAVEEVKAETPAEGGAEPEVIRKAKADEEAAEKK
jgi:large subunit ribosomal protein L25